MSSDPKTARFAFPLRGIIYPLNEVPNQYCEVLFDCAATRSKMLCMKIDFEIDLDHLQDAPAKDGQISVKLPKDQEIRFKTLNTRYQKRLSAVMRLSLIHI